MAASTVVASVLTGCGVLAASVITQGVAARMETKRAEREDKRRMEDRREREDREDRDRSAEIARERRDHQRDAYVKLIGLAARISDAMGDLLWRVRLNSSDFDSGRDLSGYDRGKWSEKWGRLRAL